MKNVGALNFIFDNCWDVFSHFNGHQVRKMKIFLFPSFHFQLVGNKFRVDQVFWGTVLNRKFRGWLFLALPNFTGPHIASFSLLGPRLWTRRCTLFFLWFDHVLSWQMFVNGSYPSEISGRPFNPKKS